LAQVESAAPLRGRDAYVRIGGSEFLPRVWTSRQVWRSAAQRDERWHDVTEAGKRRNSGPPVALYADVGGSLTSYGTLKARYSQNQSVG